MQKKIQVKNNRHYSKYITIKKYEYFFFFLDFDMATIKVIVLACLVSPSLAKINADILAGELNRVMEDIGYKELQVNKNLVVKIM